MLANELERRALSVRRHPARVESDTTLHLEENPAFNVAAKVGYLVLAIFVFGNLAFLFSLVSRDMDWKGALSVLVLPMLLVWGPIFAAIAWATRRNLRNARSDPRRRKH
jgi:hypothetical protein